MIVLNILLPITDWPAAGPKIASEIELPSKSVPAIVNLFLLSSPTDFIEILVPENVVEALLPFRFNALPAEPV